MFHLNLLHFIWYLRFIVLYCMYVFHSVYRIYMGIITVGDWELMFCYFIAPTRNKAFFLLL